MNKREYREVYLASEHWKEFRDRILLERNRCESCGLTDLCSQVFYRSHLDLHHLTYERLGRELSEDVQVLCRACHELAEDEKRSCPDYQSFIGYPGLIEFECPECEEMTGVILFHMNNKLPHPRFWTRCECTEPEYGMCVTTDEQEELCDEDATWYIEKHFNAIRMVER